MFTDNNQIRERKTVCEAANQAEKKDQMIDN